jgi:hypothetical protein
MNIALLVLCFLGCCSLAVCLQFRSATNEDITVARKVLLKEAMNPLSVSKKTLLVALDDDDFDNVQAIAFGQIRPLDNSFSELASLFGKNGNRRSKCQLSDKTQT